MLRRLRGVRGKSTDQVRVNRARAKYPRACGRQAQEIGCSPLVDREKRIEHGRHENRSTCVRLRLLVILLRIRFVRHPLTGVVHAADGIAQRSAQPGRTSKLPRKLPQQVLVGPQGAAC